MPDQLIISNTSPLLYLHLTARRARVVPVTGRLGLIAVDLDLANPH